MLEDIFRYSDYVDKKRLRDMETELEANRHLRDVVEQLGRRCERLELLCETLAEALDRNGVISREELKVLMQQVDLRDGVEDGAATDETREDAPTCPECDEFVNPRRDACVYCGADLWRDPETPDGADASNQKNDSPPPERVRCTACGQQVDKRDTYYSSTGVECRSCHFA